jgi:hypothetical protein
LGFDREAARGAVHGGSGILHALRHVPRYLVRAMQSERSHAESLLGDLARFVVLASRERAGDLLEGKEVITHIGERVLGKLGRELDQDARVGGRGGMTLVILMTMVLGHSQASRKQNGTRSDGGNKRAAHGLPFLCGCAAIDYVDTKCI